jgi:CheY-like chemotaxis protein
MSEQMTLLCVDDEPALLASMAIILQRSGYAVVCASTAEEALDRLRERAVNGIILDHFLPGRTGAELAAEIKRLTPDVPIILSTGDSSDVSTHAVNAVAHKPCHPQDLLRIVADVLRKP